MCTVADSCSLPQTKPQAQLRVPRASLLLGKRSTFALSYSTLRNAGWELVMVSGFPQSIDTPALGRILIVEDHHDTAEVLARLLIMRGDDVSVAGTFAEALRLVRQHKFRAALCDLGLPDGDGLDLVPVLRATSPGARLIALTAYSMPQDIQRAIAAGFDAYVAKPVTFQTLLCQLDGHDQAEPIEA